MLFTELLNHKEEIAGVMLVVSFSGYWSVAYLLKSRAFLKQWTTINTKLTQTLIGATKPNLEHLEQIDAIFKDNPNYLHRWSEFRETLVAEPHATNEIEAIYHATRPASEHFEKDEILTEFTGADFYRQAPGLITSIGLSMTFIFIVLGLYSLNTSAEELKLDELIGHLGSKFVSSISALVASVLFSIWQHSREEKCERILTKSLNILDQKFQRTTSELYLSLVDKRLQDLNSVMKPFGTSLADFVCEGVQQGMKVSTGELLLAINALKQEKQEGQEGSLRGILEEFRKTLSSNTQNEFQELQKTISSLSSTLSSSAAQTSTFANDLSVVVRSLKDSAEMQKSSVGESVTLLTTQVAALVSQLSDATSKQLDAFQTIANNLASSTHQSMESQRAAVNHSIENLTSKVEVLVSNLSAAGLKQAESMVGVTNSLVYKSKEANSDLTASVEKIMSQQQAVTQEFMQANQALKSSLNDLQSGAKAIKSILTDSEKSAQSILAQVDQNWKTAQTLSGSVQVSHDLFARVQKQHEQASVDMQRYQQMFKDAEQSCTRVLSMLDQNLRQYTSLTSEHLSKQLKDYDRELAKATQVFASTVRDLEETLSEAIAKKEDQEQKRVA